MMELNISLSIPDLKTAIDGLNNAYLALYNIRNSIFLFNGISDVDSKWEILINGVSQENITEKVDKRLAAVKNIYDQLIAYENTIWKMP